MTSQKLQNILSEINPYLAELTQDIEQLLFISPRGAMQIIRTMAETLVRQVAQLEKLPDQELSFGEVQATLKHEGILTPTTDNAIHFVRRQGNIASHDGTRKMLIREALTCWEYQHFILTWFIETYASADIDVPEYIEPSPITDKSNPEDLITHIKKILEAYLTKKPVEKLVSSNSAVSRKIYYKDEFIEIPGFLRDSFLLPQRFPQSATFLIRLNGEQQARILSELPNQLEGLYKHVKHFKETNDQCFFRELSLFVEEEYWRKTVIEQHAGEVLYFYQADFVILTEALGNIELTKQNFPGQTSLLNALHEQEFTHVKDLPKELVLLGKYRNVGEVALTNLFNQLKVLEQKFSEVGVIV